MRALLNAQRLQARRATAYLVTTEIGTVTNYDPNHFAARVTLQPDGFTTGWLPIASPWIGNGWGLFAPPNIGDLVTVEFINGDWGAGTVTSRFWNSIEQALAVPSGEFWLVHASGAYFKLRNSGQVQFADGAGAFLTFDGQGNIESIASTWTHDGNFVCTQTISADVDVQAGAGISLVNHVHPGVQSGGSTTLPPQG